MVTLALCSKGSRMFSPKLCSAPRALLRRAHDAVAAAGDDHVALLAHAPRESLGGLDSGASGCVRALPKTETLRNGLYRVNSRAA